MLVYLMHDKHCAGNNPIQTLKTRPCAILKIHKNYVLPMRIYSKDKKFTIQGKPTKRLKLPHGALLKSKSSYIDPQFINRSLITGAPLSMKELYMTSKPVRFKNYDLMLEMKKHFGTIWINKKIKDWRNSVNKYIRDNS